VNGPNKMTKSVKTQFTEAEAAEELGLSVDNLRALVKNHVASNEEELTNLPAAIFQRSDLLLLKFIVKQQAPSTDPC
jgi:hypothetical protein